MVAIFRMRNLNSLSDSKQVCLVLNPNSQSSVILARSFSLSFDYGALTVFHTKFFLLSSLELLSTLSFFPRFFQSSVERSLMWKKAPAKKEEKI